MKKILAPLAALAAGLALTGCAPKPNEIAPSKLASDDVKPDVKKAPPTDLEQLAQRLVTQSAAVKEGEIVLVSGGPQDLELIELVLSLPPELAFDAQYDRPLLRASMEGVSPSS